MKVEIAQIKEDEIDNLSISHDDEDGFVLLFTPDMDNTIDHYHIELTYDEAKRLRSFIDCYV